MADNEATGFEPLSPESFFHTLRRYTNEGMFSDPAYGGNRNMVGWKLIGYPGAQRAYTPDEIQVERKLPRQTCVVITMSSGLSRSEALMSAA